VEIYKFLLASGRVRGNITLSSVAARSGATIRAKEFRLKRRYNEDFPKLSRLTSNQT
jgi:hypothetical protein